MGIDFSAKVNSFNMQSIDTKNVSEVANQIFVNAQQKSGQVGSLSEKFDLSKFKKVDLGLEIYGRQISAEKVSQIVTRQAGLDIQLSQKLSTSVQYLNTQAAMSAQKDLSDKVSGKIHTQMNVEGNGNAKEVFAQPISSNIANIASMDRDKTGSNGSFTFQQRGKESGENKEDSQILSIFA